MRRTIREWGSTADERGQRFPCDDHVARPTGVLFRAIDVAAAPELTFAWLCQLRVAPYSYDWIDNFGRRSPRRRDTSNERLALNQRVMTIFRLVAFQRNEHITLLIDRTRVFGDLAGSYCVRPSPIGSRIVVKLVYRLPPCSPLRWLLPPGDLVMMRKQLLTLKQLAEREHAASQDRATEPAASPS
jgi:hypothetical protein